MTDIAIDGGPFPACTRHGARPADRAGLRRLAAETAAALPARPAAVLGVGEFMYLPQLVAEAAGAATCWSTTRSPICLADRDGYPVRSGIAFAAPDAPGVTGYLYNVEEIGDGPLVIVFERPEHRAAADDLLAALGREVVAVTYTRIGSFPPADVTFLLKDLSSADLERPTEEREAGMQGGAHYSETLPIEFQPSAEYQALFHELLERHAQRVATHVVALAELLVERHADTGGPVLVSLARAGTPVGVLLRRALLARHGLDAPHYSVSIIRDRGLDQVALAHVLERHPASSLQFVDGWTGKGAISRELTKVLDAHAARTGVRLDDQLAVLSDPGHCTTVFATREDALVPSACLNSTVCGLISRTVLNDRWIGPGDFHGVKCYWELAERDVSALFVDTIVERFASVDEAELAALRAEREQAEPAAFQGLDEVRAIAAEHGIENLNLVKPGVGEATRVLLRRMPMKIIVERGCDEETAHLVSLAQERGVELEWRSGMRYRAHGLIRPLT